MGANRDLIASNLVFLMTAYSLPNPTANVKHI